jgi:RES domain-containing protein
VGVGAGLRELSGRFFRVLDADDDDPLCLKPHRTPGRFHRAGERALYLSPSPDAAAIAVGDLVRPGDRARRVIALELSDAQVLDLLDEKACAALGVVYADASAPWGRVLESGKTPPSWRVADRVRAAGVAGVIDPSRRAPGVGLWCVTLFNWNGATGPRVSVLGKSKSIAIPVDYRGGKNLLANFR